MDLASVNVAVVVIHPHKPESREVRVAMGAVAPTPIRARDAEAVLRGQHITPQLLARMGEEMTRGLAPRTTSLRATPAYKKEMVRIMTEKALENLLRS
jgi:carbon-monoxide dehydrogenase medium subunit